MTPLERAIKELETMRQCKSTGVIRYAALSDAIAAIKRLLPAEEEDIKSDEEQVEELHQALTSHTNKLHNQ